MAALARDAVVLVDEKRDATLKSTESHAPARMLGAPLPARPAEEMKAKVVLAGAPGVGKSSLVRRYVLNEFSDRYLHTLGAIVYKRVVHVEVWPGRVVRVTLTVWDTMGRGAGDDLLHEVDLFNAQGVLAVCDVTDAGTVGPLRARVQAAFRAAGDVPTHILMNKADLGPREDAREEGLQVARERGAPCYLTSAKAGDNVVAAFEDLARRIVERQVLPPATLDSVDRRLVDRCAPGPLSIVDAARAERISVLFAEARLERLRRNGLLAYAGIGLDARGLPEVSYTRTAKPFPMAVVEIAC